MTTDKHKITPEMQADLDAIEAALSGASPDAELTDLGRLALELRADRPEPDPFFTRELDAKAADGFPRPRRMGVKWLGGMSSQLLAGSVATVLIVTVVGVSLLQSTGDEGLEVGSAGSVVEDSSGAGSVAESAPEPQFDAGTAESGGGGGGAAPSARTPNRKSLQRRSSAATGDEAGPTAAAALPAIGGGSAGSDARERRVQETSASLTLTTPPDRINDVADGVIRVTDQLGGFVVSSTVSSTDGDGGGGLFEIRVPSAKLQVALAELSKLAHVSQRQQASQDITREAVSARDRLQDARAERTALLRRLARATTDAEIQSAKRRLRAVSARIATAKADLARVNNRASFSNIAVSLAADPNAGEPGTDDGQWSPGDAARDAIRVLEVIAGVLLIALAIGVPAALLIALLVLAARLTTRRRRERALDAI